MLLETTSKKKCSVSNKISSNNQFINSICRSRRILYVENMVADCSYSLLNFLLIIPPYHCLISLRQIQAFIYDASPLQFQVGIDKNCQLMLVGKPYAMSGYAVAFPKGQTELKEEMDDLILELQDDGKGYAQGLSSLTCTFT